MRGNRIKTLCFMLISLIIAACGGGGSGDNGNNNNGSIETSNKARITQDCDLGGLTGEMIIDIEVISDTGITWGAGPTPDITGVIGTGNVTYFTEGSVNSPTASYIFSGRDNFADFTQTSPSIERFLVQWVGDGNNLDFIVNPFGQGPAYTNCTLTGYELI